MIHFSHFLHPRFRYAFGYSTQVATQPKEKFLHSRVSYSVVAKNAMISIRFLVSIHFVTQPKPQPGAATRNTSAEEFD